MERSIGEQGDKAAKFNQGRHIHILEGVFHTRNYHHHQRGPSPHPATFAGQIVAVFPQGQHHTDQGGCLAGGWRNRWRQSAQCLQHEPVRVPEFLHGNADQDRGVQYHLPESNQAVSECARRHRTR